MVVVDTSIFSLYLRRQTPLSDPLLKTFLDLFSNNQIILLGPIYQEILSGIRFEEQFIRVSKMLSGFLIELANKQDHQLAARYFNTCRQNGIQGSSFDFLICAMATRKNAPIFTLDKDFSHYQKYIPIELLQ